MSENLTTPSNIQPEFDWDTIGKKQDFYSKDEIERLELLYGGTLKSLVDHELVDGVVVSKTIKK